MGKCNGTFYFAAKTVKKTKKTRVTSASTQTDSEPSQVDQNKTVDFVSSTEDTIVVKEEFPKSAEEPLLPKMAIDAEANETEEFASETIETEQMTAKINESETAEVEKLVNTETVQEVNNIVSSQVASKRSNTSKQTAKKIVEVQNSAVKMNETQNLPKTDEFQEKTKTNEAQKVSRPNTTTKKNDLTKDSTSKSNEGQKSKTNEPSSKPNASKAATKTNATQKRSPAKTTASQKQSPTTTNEDQKITTTQKQSPTTTNKKQVVTKTNVGQKQAPKKTNEKQTVRKTTAAQKQAPTKTKEKQNLDDTQTINKTIDDTIKTNEVSNQKANKTNDIENPSSPQQTSTVTNQESSEPYDSQNENTSEFMSVNIKTEPFDDYNDENIALNNETPTENIVVGKDRLINLPKDTIITVLNQTSPMSVSPGTAQSKKTKASSTIADAIAKKAKLNTSKDKIEYKQTLLNFPSLTSPQSKNKNDLDVLEISIGNEILLVSKEQPIASMVRENTMIESAQSNGSYDMMYMPSEGHEPPSVTPSLSIFPVQSNNAG